MAEVEDFRGWSKATSAMRMSCFDTVVGWIKTCLDFYQALLGVYELSKEINLVPTERA